MAKYRKKPVVIEAVQWDGVGLQDPPDWVRMALKLGIMDRAGDGNGLVIETLEGQMKVSPDDWIIRGVKGELYPCKPDIFAATYDPA